MLNSLDTLRHTLGHHLDLKIGPILEPFWVQNRYKIDHKIDAKILSILIPIFGAILAQKINSGPQLGFFQAPSWRLELIFRGIKGVNLGKNGVRSEGAFAYLNSASTWLEFGPILVDFWSHVHLDTQFCGPFWRKKLILGPNLVFFRLQVGAWN